MPVATDVRISTGLSVQFGSIGVAGNGNFTITGEGMYSAVQTIGTGAAEAIGFGEVGLESGWGWWFLKNLSETNIITLSLDDAGTVMAFGRLLPGQSMVLPVDFQFSLLAQAETVACDLQIVLTGAS